MPLFNEALEPTINNAKIAKSAMCLAKAKEIFISHLNSCYLKLFTPTIISRCDIKLEIALISLVEIEESINQPNMVWRKQLPNLIRSAGLFAAIFMLVAATVFVTVPSWATSLGNNSVPSFATPINLSNDNAAAKFPNVQSNGLHVYVSWTEGAKGIKFRASSNGGATWQPPVTSPALTLNISTPSAVAQYPLMSDNGSNVYVVWSQGTSSDTMQVYEATSTNYGASFSAPVQLTSGDGGWITPVIASWGDDVYVAYIYNSAGGNSNNRVAYMTCSADSGASGSWTRAFQIGEREPQLAAWGGQYVYAVADWNLYASNNNCGSWNLDQNAFKNSTPREPWIWAYGQNVYTAWETGSGTSAVWTTISNSNGASWSTPSIVNASVTDDWAPMVWAYGNSAWIASREYPGGAQGQVWIYTTNNAGASWSTASLSGKGMKATAETFPYTVVSSDGQNVFVGWSHQVSSGYWTFVISYSSNGGMTWLAPPGKDISGNSNGEAGFENDVATGSISAYSTNCYATWQFTNGTVNQVYFTYS